MKHQKGFTLPEIIIITGIFLLLFGFIIFNVLNAQHQTNVTTTMETLIADMKSQQLKAMTGATEGRSTADTYGIYFGTNSYTLFHGSAPHGDSSDFVIHLANTLQMTTTFPGSKVIFSAGSGEVSGFTSGQNTLTIQAVTNNNQRIITVNRWGAITNVQ